MLFGPMNPFPQKKILTFNKHTDDFTFYVSEAVPESDQLPESLFDNDAGYWTNLTEVHMAGVGTALKKTSGPGAESKGVKAHFILNDSGILSLLHAELVVEKTLSPEEEAEEERRKEEEEAKAESPLSKLGSTISKLFTGGEEKKVDNESIPESGKGEANEEENLSQEKKTEGEKKADGAAKKVKDKTESKNDTKTDGSAEKKKPKVVIMKEVLGVEGVLEDIDFKLQVTRDQFQDLCSDLFDRVKGPVEKALKSSGLTMDVINQVILVGAGTRVPKVQEVLSKAVGMDLGKSLNTDEAAAMGAAYRAADLSAGFKVKKFITKDAVVFPIQD
ncbi:hypothetical protein J437_LFUL000978 [Ladona fulva]|uniref:Hypoxia up-regulated protein 1 n=1 Tax=Ladona fulva TaxID=123851 RepID=A0A8K0P5P0_LADFU|nr:hypothetical protein J437_LFUL000978 [Ladona fulva]